MSENTEHHPEAPQATAESAGDELQTLMAELNQARAAIAEHDREVGSLKRQLATEQERAHRELARAKAEATALTRRLEAQRAPLDRAAELSVQRVMASFPTPHDQPLTELLRTAEVTYQTALRSPVSPAALAMLYCSALERALEVALIHPFSQALDRDRMRATFLAANALHTKTKGARYHEHLLDMLDAHRPVRSVTLGSLRVLLGNLHLSRLGLLSRFLEKQLRGEPGFLAHLSRYLGELKGDL